MNEQRQEKIKFNALRRLPRGEVFENRVNEIPMMAILKTGIGDLIADFRDAEKSRWYGVLKYKDAEFHFRHGVCQNIKKGQSMRVSVFEHNVINDNVDFSKEKKV